MSTLQALFNIICLFVLAAFVRETLADNECANRADGYNLRRYTCFSYQACEKQKEVTVSCKPNVYDRDSGSCLPIGSGSSYCGREASSCGDVWTGMQSDPDLQTFFFCIVGTPLNYTRQYCPETTHFNNVTQTCG